MGDADVVSRGSGERLQAHGAGDAPARAAGTPVPAILIKDKAGTEGPVTFADRGDVIVVDGVPREIILRSGRQVATIDNKGPERQSAALAQLEKVTK